MALLFVTPQTVYAQTGWQEASELPPGPSTLLWGSRINIDNNWCCSPRKGQPDEEAPLIQSLRDRAFRDGPVLSLSLAGKRSVRLVDSGTGCADDMCRTHTLIEYWPAQGYYVVEVTLFEGRQAYLISESEGRITLVFAPPILSPSGRYAIAWDDLPAYGKGVQLIDMSHYPPKMIEVPRPPTCLTAKTYGYVRPQAVWHGDAHISFEGKSPVGGDEDTKQVLRIVDGKPEWQC